MKGEGQASPDFPTNLALVIGVILTVLVALFLAFSDDLQTRLPSPIRPTAVVAFSGQATPVPLASADFPSPSNTPDQTAEPAASPTVTSIPVITGANCNNVPNGWFPVVAGPADTLYTLSIQYGATIGEIIQANCLETGVIFPGMTIYVPPTPPTREPCGPPGWWVDYIVRPGDTLGGLALRHGTTVYAIMRANCLSETKIFAGRHLFLPPIPATVPPPPTVIVPSSTPTASPTATSTGLPSPTPSATAQGTASPTSTTTVPAGTPTATGTPTVTGTPPVTNTPLPTVSTTPTSNLTTTPTSTVGPSPTAVPTATPTLPPTNTPVPTQQPTNTPQPTATNPPQPSNTPEF